MILILSEQYDQSTNEVINWLTHYNQEYIRINDTDNCEIVKIDCYNDKVVMNINGYTLDFNDISTYWYRRGNFKIKVPILSSIQEIPFYEDIKKNLMRETSTLVEYLHLLLKKKKHIGSYFDNYTNKLHNLSIAKKCGLKIPNTTITSKKEVVQSFLGVEKEIITKAISETIMLHYDNSIAIQAYTNEVKANEINDYNNFIFPSLIQNKIEKKFEVRIFYLDKSFYTMAIFSQQNKKTKVDFRNYDRNKPNRFIPYSLPKEIENKLTSFMTYQKLTSGSIDMVIDINGDYIFLEVNPVGQYGMISYPCNYFLHKKIAEYLCVH